MSINHFSDRYKNHLITQGMKKTKQIKKYKMLKHTQGSDTNKCEIF